MIDDGVGGTFRTAADTCDDSVSIPGGEHAGALHLRRRAGSRRLAHG
jgi:hypothetical protein